MDKRDQTTHLRKGRHYLEGGLPVRLHGQYRVNVVQ